MSKRNCSVAGSLEIVEGTLDDYKKLSCYHYRSEKLGPFCKIFALKPVRRISICERFDCAGVIVYSMPVPGSQLRGVACGGAFSGLDRRSRLAVLNKNVRCISRVIIEPRFRGLGLATRLVKETIGLMDVAVIEAMAVMGLINPFFKKAGMAEYIPPDCERTVRLETAFDMVGICGNELIDAKLAQSKIENLDSSQSGFIEEQIRKFLLAYGKNAQLKNGIERTRFVLSRLGQRPAYYVWFNPKVKVKV